MAQTRVSANVNGTDLCLSDMLAGRWSGKRGSGVLLQEIIDVLDINLAASNSFSSHIEQYSYVAGWLDRSHPPEGNSLWSSVPSSHRFLAFLNYYTLQRRRS